jgi:hypothetical protein
MTRSVMAPKTYAWPMVVKANSVLPTAESAKIRGCSLTACQSTPRPRPMTPFGTGGAPAGTGFGRVTRVLSSSQLRHTSSP